MKRCFTFSNYQDCKPVAQFLQTVISSTVHIQLGNAITVAEDVHSTAILEGKRFVAKNSIVCNWVDASNSELPLNLVPFAIITLSKNHLDSHRCLSRSALSSVYRFADFCEKYLKRNVFTQLRNDGTIAFLIEQTNSLEHHLKIVESVKEHKGYLNDIIYTDLVFTDCFGNSIWVKIKPRIKIRGFILSFTYYYLLITWLHAKTCFKFCNNLCIFCYFFFFRFY